jgi:para-nitrobenzyl esterase
LHELAGTHTIPLLSQNKAKQGGCMAIAPSRRDFLKSASASALLLPVWGSTALAFQAEPVVGTTRFGKILGRRTNGSCVFKGVPYARTPTRLAPPAAPKRWRDTRDALEFGPRAIQAAASLEGMSESCQMLNVWTPALGRGKRPVMVWLHGGGFMNGSANTDLYDGTDLNREGDVVVVTLNHRLGAFGYLQLAEAGSEYESSGCVGMLDIVAALRWIHENIENFGGDAGNVTLFGESGGGGKVIALMAMPAAKGLFHRAIVQSGALLRTAITAEQGRLFAAELFAEMKLSPAEYQKLLSAPPEVLMRAQAAVLRRAGTPGSGGSTAQRPFSPIIGRELPEQPFDPLAPKVSANVPLLIGANKEETRFFFTGTPELYALDAANLKARLQPLLGQQTDTVVDAYRKFRPDASATDLFFAITTAQMYGYTTIRVAQRKAEQRRAPAYLYQFAYEGSQLGGNPPVAIKSGHSMEIPFVFAHPRTGPDGSIPDHERSLSRQMSQAWIAFAKNGNPNHTGMPQWPAYSTEQRAAMVFDKNSAVVADPHPQERQLWERLLT